MEWGVENLFWWRRNFFLLEKQDSNGCHYYKAKKKTWNRALWCQQTKSNNTCKLLARYILVFSQRYSHCTLFLMDAILEHDCFRMLLKWYSSATSICEQRLGPIFIVWSPILVSHRVRPMGDYVSRAPEKQCGGLRLICMVSCIPEILRAIQDVWLMLFNTENIECSFW